MAYLHRTTETWSWDGLLDNRQPTRASTDFRADEQGRFVNILFPRVGNGRKKQSAYEATIKWEDMERLIEKFCEGGNVEALAVREAMKLATAAKELGWQQPPQSN